jgi:Tfp pilus assembly protein PilN
MRLNINLASQKYEDARSFYARWGTALGLLLVVTIVLALLAWSNHSSSVQANRRIAELQTKIADLDRERSAAEATLNLAENHDVREQSMFWNERFSQRSFSWTQLFSDLEKVMPNRAYVVSVQPVPTTDKHTLKIKIVVDGETHDDANDLVKRMEASARFRQAAIVRESMQAAKGGLPTWQFDIEAQYLPPPATVVAREGQP